MANYDVGDSVRFVVSFTNATNDAADPSVVTFKHTPPGGSTVTYVYGTDEEVVRTGTGAYRCDIVLTASGSHHWRWTGTGSVNAAEEGYVPVRKTYFA